MFFEDDHCDRCAFSGRARFGVFGEYIFDDGDRSSVATQNAWCNGCCAITHVEKRRLADDLAAALKRHQDGIVTESDMQAAKSPNYSMADFVAMRIKLFTDEIRHFKDRKSSNRCIEGGLSNFIPREDEKRNVLDALVHPSCGGMLRRRAIGHARTSLIRFRLDSEGNRLPQEDDYTDEDRRLCGDRRRK